MPIAFRHSLNLRLILYVLLCSTGISLGATYWDWNRHQTEYQVMVCRKIASSLQAHQASVLADTHPTTSEKAVSLLETIRITHGIAAIQWQIPPYTLTATAPNPLPPSTWIQTCQWGQATLTITGNRDTLLADLSLQMGTILLSESSKIFFSAFLMLALSRLMITRHLVKIAEYANQLDLTQLNKPLYLYRHPWLEPHSKDELSQVVNAFNGMRLFLQNELYTRQEAERSIKELNEQLEEKIRQRTLQMDHSNQELKQTLHQLQHAQKQLVENEKMAALGGLVAGIAHEVNTPVGIGVTAASHLKQLTDEVVKLAQNKQLKRSDLDHYLQSATDSANILLKNLNRAATIVQSFKQVAVDQALQEKRVFHVKEYLQEILTSLSPKLKHAKHQVYVECDPKLSLYSDPGALSQIVSNLILNSLLHAYEPDESGEIRIRMYTADQQCYLVYADNGKGIPETHLPKIFDPFFTTKRGSGGTGLGLHILFNMVTQGLQGQVSCTSQVGQGTTFTIQFPIADPAAPTGAGEKAPTIGDP